MEVSVIIPTYKRPRLVLQALHSLQNQNYTAFEIIVVDSPVNLETEHLIMDFNKKARVTVNYISTDSTALHEKRHIGAMAAKGDILVFIDDDVICDKNWLSELIKPYTDSEVGCVGGKILPKWEAEPPEWVKRYPASLSLLDLGSEIKELKTPKIYGCNFSIRRSLMFEVGGSNPDVFGDRKQIWYTGDGETGLLRKVLIAERKIIYTPHAIVWHVIPESRLTVGYFKKRNFQEGISRSFFVHRTGKFSGIKLFYRSCIFGIATIVCKILGLLGKILRKDDYIKYEFACSSFKSRSIYEFKLIYDKKLRESIERRSWL